MTKGIAHVQRFIEQILSTEAEELDCLGVLGIVERYVDLHAAGIDPVKLLPGLPLHFKHCPDCADMYAVLLDLAQMEASNLLPDIDALWRDLEAMTLPRSGAASAKGAILSGMLAGPASALAVGTAGPQADPTMIEAASTAPSPSQAMLPTPPRDSMLVRWRRFFFGAAAAPAARAEAAQSPAGRPAPGWGALALASVVAIGLGLGWWQADARGRAARGRLTAMRAMLLDQARREIGDNPEMADILSKVDRVTVGRSEDGVWVRVFYSPNYDRAVVFLGEMPKLARGQQLEGWLQRSGAPAKSTGKMTAAALSADEFYWAIPCRGPISDDTTFVLTLEPDHEPVVSVALGP